MKISGSIGLAAVLFCVASMPVEAGSSQVGLDVAPVYSTLKSGAKQMTWLRVGLDGFELQSDRKRPPVNLAIVLDKSGSMQGEKIKRAREAAIDALKLLGPDDIVSIVTYDSSVNVLVPATKMTDRESVTTAISGINPGGNTALFAGVSKGAAEVRKFLDKEHVNRVILLSDGLANVGPASPGELGSLGESLLKENISVSTLGLGLGYNEDLMVQLARKSGGNHQFIEDASELADVFRREFDDVLSVVAQEIDVKVTIPEGIRPVRVLGNDADINGQQIVTRLSAIYSGQNKHVVIELELAEADPGSQLALADVSVSYTNMKTEKTDTLSDSVKVAFSDSDQEVRNSLNRKVMADVVALVSSEQNKLATVHLDAGDLEACRTVLNDNIKYLEINAFLCPPSDTKLAQLKSWNADQLRRLEGVTSNAAPAANAARKSLRLYQNVVDQQQAIAPTKNAPAPKAVPQP